jgi:hypothetical protein
MLNRTLLQQQPAARAAQTPVRAYLMEYSANGEGAIAWSFLYNPEEISTSKDAQYATSPTMGALPSTSYSGPDLRTVQLDNLVLDGWFNGRSMGKLAEGLERLTLAKTSGSAGAIGEPGSAFTYQTPPVLSFVMGGRTVIAPCVIVSTNRKETAWFGDGAIAVATVGFTLREVSRSDLVS